MESGLPIVLHFPVGWIRIAIGSSFSTGFALQFSAEKIFLQKIIFFRPNLKAQDAGLMKLGRALAPASSPPPDMLIDWAVIKAVKQCSKFVEWVFTALHGMQTWSSDENSVYRSVRLSLCPTVCPSVCQMRGLWQNRRKICPDFYTIRKII